MRVNLIGIPVRDQENAFKFYTEILGFIVKHDIPMGGGNRWLTVVPKDDPSGTEISLEPAPNHFEPSKVYQNALFEAKIPYTQFDVDNVQQEYDRLTELGVEFTKEPVEAGPVKIATLNDTCGNYILLVENVSVP